MDEFIGTTRSQIKLGAFAGKKLIGYALTNKSSKEELYFSWFGVLKKYRGKGAGRKLVKKIETCARNIGFKRISLHTQNRFRKAISLYLYLKEGYDITGTYLASDGEIMVQMIKRL